MNMDELIANARDCGFADPELLRKMARDAVLLRQDGMVSETYPGSKIGGLPRLPPSVPWPRRDGRSLAFIAQIELVSQPGIAVEQGLPGKGLLLFFYDAEQNTWGFDPKDAGSFAVVYVPGDADASVISEWPDDLPKDARYKACSLSSEETMTLPPGESVLIEDLNLDPEQLDIYLDILEKTYDEGSWGDRCLLAGYPDQIQGDMMLECELVSAGLYCGDASAYHDPRLPVFRRQAHEWRLLLQVPSVQATGMMWGDAGCLYYWIRENDLRERRFDRAWMILQCH